jgi:hypothetical protein
MTEVTRQEIAQEFYSNRCYVCQKKFGKYFQFHHLWYYTDEQVFSDFSNPKKYWAYVSQRIMEEPNRFMLLCKICHSRIDKRRGGLKRMKPDKTARLFIATMLSKEFQVKDIVPFLHRNLTHYYE